jgi:hypothetical protein
MTTKKMALSATVITPSWEVDNNASAAGTATVPKSAAGNNFSKTRITIQLNVVRNIITTSSNKTSVPNEIKANAK